MDLESGLYLYVPFPEEKGGLTDREILLAQMPSYVGSPGAGKRPPWPFPSHLTWNTVGLADKCLLCWEQLGYGSLYRQLPCGHILHLPCLDRWLRIDGCCPLCRHAFYYARLPRVMYVQESSSRAVDGEGSYQGRMEPMTCIMWLIRMVCARIWKDRKS